MNKIQRFIKELQEMDFGPLYADVNVVDPDTGEILVRAGNDVNDDDLERVLHVVLVHRGSVWTIIDNGIYLASRI